MFRILLVTPSLSEGCRGSARSEHGDENGYCFHDKPELSEEGGGRGLWGQGIRELGWRLLTGRWPERMGLVCWGRRHSWHTVALPMRYSGSACCF